MPYIIDHTSTNFRMQKLPLTYNKELHRYVR
jgi:hypothetical protein